MRIPRLPAAVGLAFACALLTAATAHAQVSPSMDSPDTPNGLPEPAAPTHPVTDDSAQEQGPTLKVSSNIVHVFFNVRDKDNQIITSLKPGDCTVQDNGQERPIKSFELVKGQPLSLGVLIDTSGSQLRLLPMEQEAGGQFLKEVLRPATDEAFVMSFDISVDLVADYTNEVSRLKKALNGVEINTGTGGGDFIPGLSKNRGTLLYDAIYLASHDEFKQEAGRHAMVLLTDGQDEGSKTKIQEAIESAQRADATVFVVLLYDPQAYGSVFGYAGDHDVKKITDATGGRVYVVGHDGKKLEATFDLLNEALHKQYALTFTPANLDGKYHSLNVQCHGDGLKVDARKGYYAVAEPAD